MAPEHAARHRAARALIGSAPEPGSRGRRAGPRSLRLRAARGRADLPLRRRGPAPSSASFTSRGRPRVGRSGNGALVGARSFSWSRGSTGPERGGCGPSGSSRRHAPTARRPSAGSSGRSWSASFPDARSRPRRPPGVPRPSTTTSDGTRRCVREHWRHASVFVSGDRYRHRQSANDADSDLTTDFVDGAAVVARDRSQQAPAPSSLRSRAFRRPRALAVVLALLARLLPVPSSALPRRQPDDPIDRRTDDSSLHAIRACLAAAPPRPPRRRVRSTIRACCSTQQGAPITGNVNLVLHDLRAPRTGGSGAVDRDPSAA